MRGSATIAIAMAVLVSQQSFGQPSPLVRLQFDDSLENTGTADIAGITAGERATFSDLSLPPLASPGKSMQFAPTADNDNGVAIIIPDNPSLNVESFTLTTWIDPNGPGKAALGTTLYSRYASGGASNKGFFVGTSWSSPVGFDSSIRHLRLIANIDSASKFTDSNVPNTNEYTNSPEIDFDTDWIFIAFSYDATTSTGKTYFGVNDNPSALTGPENGTVFDAVGAPDVPDSALNGQVGLRWDGNRAYDGFMDDFRLYGSALSAAEIEAVRLATEPEFPPGDFDEDGDVDGRDFLVWQRGGSPNGIDSGDLAIWQSHYGSGSLVSNISSVPEPLSSIIVAGLLAGALFRRRA